MGDIQCEKCGWIGDEGLYSHAHPKGSADLICPACQQVIEGLEVDWKERHDAVESELAEVRAELAAVKAALPKWRKGKRQYVLQVAKLNAALVWDYGGGKWASVLVGGVNTDPDSHADEQAAMTAVTEALGLPPCEVCE